MIEILSYLRSCWNDIILKTGLIYVRHLLIINIQSIRRTNQKVEFALEKYAQRVYMFCVIDMDIETHSTNCVENTAKGCAPTGANTGVVRGMATSRSHHYAIELLWSRHTERVMAYHRASHRAESDTICAVCFNVHVDDAVRIHSLRVLFKCKIYFLISSADDL